MSLALAVACSLAFSLTGGRPGLIDVAERVWYSVLKES